MKAVILAGGFGKRLHPLTLELPKPLIPLCGIPIMQYVLDLLKQNGIYEAVILLFHQPKLIKNYFGDGRQFGMKLDYLLPDKDLGTAGCVKYAERILDSTFLVVSADIICEFNLTQIIKFHNEKKSLATLALTRVKNPLEYGIVILKESGQIGHFLEKPTWREVFSDTINTGIYVLEPEIFSHIPNDRSFDFSLNLFPVLLNKKLKLFGSVDNGYWKDIGNIDEYKDASRYILRKKKLDKFVQIGENSFVGDNVFIWNSIIGRNAQIGRGCRIVNSIIWDNVEAGKESLINDSIICNKVVLGERGVVEEGAVIGSGCKIGPDSKIKSNIKIWPHKIIEEGSVVNSSMIQKKHWAKNIFGAYGITGCCNVDITPEFAAKLGAAFGAMVGAGSHVTSSLDGHRSSRMIHRAITSGLLSSGVNVSNLENVPIPINRYELKALKSKGGFHVRKSPFDPQIIDIKFFDGNALDLPKNKEKIIERFYWAEDYERADIDSVGEMSFPFYRVAGEYKEGLLNYIDTEKIKNRKFKVVIDYAFGSASSIFPAILGEFGCDAVALNAHLDEKKLAKSKSDFDKSLKQLSKITVTLDADIGIMFDAGAEKIFIIDEEGQVVSGDKALLFFSYLISKIDSPKQIAVPFSASSAIDKVANKFGVSVVRTGNGFRQMAESCQGLDILFLGEPLGGYIFPKFLCSFDSMLSTAKLLELLSGFDISVSKIISSLPDRYLKKDSLPCANALKGSVVRTIFDKRDGDNTELLDGVKIHFGSDWVLVNGHPDRHEIYIICESDDLSRCEKLLAKYKDIVQGIIDIGKNIESSS